MFNRQMLSHLALRGAQQPRGDMIAERPFLKKTTPGGIRTPNPRFRRPMLCPIELRVQTDLSYPLACIADCLRAYSTGNIPALGQESHCSG